MNSFQVMLFAIQFLFLGIGIGSGVGEWDLFSIILGLINLSPLSGAKPWDSKKDV